jgi:hypothetical protein
VKVDEVLAFGGDSSNEESSHHRDIQKLASSTHNPKDWSTMATLNLGIIDDDLHQAARVYAASNRLTIKQLVLECLADRLNQPAPVQPQRGAPKKEAHNDHD